jgi:AAA family ATP:ADP antiporter
MGSVTLVMMLIGRSVFQKFGWKTAALVTPTVSIYIIELTFFVRKSP